MVIRPLSEESVAFLDLKATAVGKLKGQNQIVIKVMINASFIFSQKYKIGDILMNLMSCNVYIYILNLNPNYTHRSPG